MNTTLFYGGRHVVIFSYEELKAYVREDFERFYQMGFDEQQIISAVVNEYAHGEGFCQTEYVCILVFLALRFRERGLNCHSLTEKIRESQGTLNEVQDSLGDDAPNFQAGLSAVMNL